MPAPRIPLSCLLAACALAPACGGGGSPTGPGAPPTPEPGSSVSGVVFYDENGNGALDGGENVRLPGVTVNVGGRTGQSAAGGAFTVSGVPSGSQTARAQTLPPYFLAGASVPLTVPQAAGAPVFVPAMLPIGTNRPNRYMAFGDSISSGEGSSDDRGYASWLEADLGAYWGQAEVRNEGSPGSRSIAGEGRLDGVLARVRPAYTLILYGTNDWNELECKVDFPCYTIDALRSMIRQAKDRASLPVVGTIPPVNTAYADRSPPERQEWVKRMNELVRPMVAQEGAALADVHAAMLREGDVTALFVDHVHPNDRGYQIMAREWFRAITTASPTAASALAESWDLGEPISGNAPRHSLWMPPSRVAGTGRPHRR
jgi:lysophospholipase L1-like esterase